MNIPSLQYDVVIIGGGLAGLCNAIHLAKKNISVVVFEKNEYPKNKVCGEYISNEVLPYLNYLGIDVFELGANKIDQFELSTTNNKLLNSKLPLGGFGISRYCLDEKLAQKARSKSVSIRKETVNAIEFNDDLFTITTQSNLQLKSKIVIGAYGKRANLDKKLQRDFIKKKSPYLAVKTYATGNFPQDTVALHNFEGGYCGVSKVEKDKINICYITNYSSFKKYKGIADFEEKVVLKNSYLRDIYASSNFLLEKPLSISQISFETKKPIENHIIMCGDTAGMIHPLCGNGMSMAMRAAQIASNLIADYFSKKIDSRSELEKQYTKQWNKEFKTRLSAGHVVANLFRKPTISSISLNVLKSLPFLLPAIIKLTHGKTMKV